MKKYLALCGSVIILAACSGVPCSEHEKNAKTPIYFDYNSADITPESKAVLDDGLIYLRGHRFRKIQLEGWADEQGGENQHNMDLSKRRAWVVRNYMIENGIRENRITIQWHGIDEGDPYEIHRRVDVTIE